MPDTESDIFEADRKMEALFSSTSQNTEELETVEEVPEVHQAHTTGQSISGKVVFSNGSPAKGKQIVCFGLKNIGASTDEYGRYSLSGLDDGGSIISRNAY